MKIMQVKKVVNISIFHLVDPKLKFAISRNTKNEKKKKT